MLRREVMDGDSVHCPLYMPHKSYICTNMASASPWPQPAITLAALRTFTPFTAAHVEAARGLEAALCAAVWQDDGRAGELLSCELAVCEAAATVRDDTPTGATARIVVKDLRAHERAVRLILATVPRPDCPAQLLQAYMDIASAGLSIPSIASYSAEALYPVVYYCCVAGVPGAGNVLAHLLSLPVDGTLRPLAAMAALHASARSFGRGFADYAIGAALAITSNLTLFETPNADVDSFVLGHMPSVFRWLLVIDRMPQCQTALHWVCGCASDHAAHPTDEMVRGFADTMAMASFVKHGDLDYDVQVVTGVGTFCKYRQYDWMGTHAMLEPDELIIGACMRFRVNYPQHSFASVATLCILRLSAWARQPSPDMVASAVLDVLEDSAADNDSVVDAIKHAVAVSCRVLAGTSDDDVRAGAVSARVIKMLLAATAALTEQCALTPGLYELILAATQRIATLLTDPAHAAACRAIPVAARMRNAIDTALDDLKGLSTLQVRSPEGVVLIECLLNAVCDLGYVDLTSELQPFVRIVAPLRDAVRLTMRWQQLRCDEPPVSVFATRDPERIMAMLEQLDLQTCGVTIKCAAAQALLRILTTGGTQDLQTRASAFTAANYERVPVLAIAMSHVMMHDGRAMGPYDAFVALLRAMNRCEVRSARTITHRLLTLLQRNPLAAVGFVCAVAAVVDNHASVAGIELTALVEPVVAAALKGSPFVVHALCERLTPYLQEDNVMCDVGVRMLVPGLAHVSKSTPDVLINALARQQLIRMFINTVKGGASLRPEMMDMLAILIRSSGPDGHDISRDLANGVLATIVNRPAHKAIGCFSALVTGGADVLRQAFSMTARMSSGAQIVRRLADILMHSTPVCATLHRPVAETLARLTAAHLTCWFSGRVVRALYATEWSAPACADLHATCAVHLFCRSITCTSVWRRRAAKICATCREPLCRICASTHTGCVAPARCATTDTLVQLCWARDCTEMRPTALDVFCSNACSVRRSAPVNPCIACGAAVTSFQCPHCSLARFCRPCQPLADAHVGRCQARGPLAVPIRCPCKPSQPAISVCMRCRKPACDSCAYSHTECTMKDVCDSCGRRGRACRGCGTAHFCKAAQCMQAYAEHYASCSVMCSAQCGQPAVSSVTCTKCTHATYCSAACCTRDAAHHARLCLGNAVYTCTVCHCMVSDSADTVARHETTCRTDTACRTCGQPATAACSTCAMRIACDAHASLVDTHASFHVAHRCSNCGVKEGGLLRCANCYIVRFCSACRGTADEHLAVCRTTPNCRLCARTATVACAQCSQQLLCTHHESFMAQHARMHAHPCSVCGSADAQPCAVCFAQPVCAASVCRTKHAKQSMLRTCAVCHKAKGREDCEVCMVATFCDAQACRAGARAHTTACRGSTTCRICEQPAILVCAVCSMRLVCREHMSAMHMHMRMHE
jgi:hypothetical protein